MQRPASPWLAIVADDLTSAADAAAPFVARGHAATLSRERTSASHAEVLAVDAATRSMTARTSEERTRQLVTELAGAALLFKTVDSTLRGHVRSELAAAFAASGRTRLVLAPAFPDAGRTTVGGLQRVNGVPVDRSPYAADPVHPATTARLADLVPTDADVLLLDADTQAALDAGVGAIDNPRDCLWAGSPGLAHALATRFDRGPGPDVAPGVSGDILVAIGSANAASRRQGQLVRTLPGVSVVMTPDVRVDDPRPLLQALGAEASARLQARNAAALIATGGDTLATLLDILDVHTLTLLGELEPGFPLSETRLANGRRLFVAMKAGGFGDEGTLVRAVTTLRHGPLEYTA